MWFVAPAPRAADGKPDVEVEYLFHHRFPDGEKYFNRTEPQALNATTLPPEFSMAAGHQLPGSGQPVDAPAKDLGADLPG